MGPQNKKSQSSVFPFSSNKHNATALIEPFLSHHPTIGNSQNPLKDHLTEPTWPKKTSPKPPPSTTITTTTITLRRSHYPLHLHSMAPSKVSPTTLLRRSHTPLSAFRNPFHRLAPLTPPLFRRTTRDTKQFPVGLCPLILILFYLVFWVWFELGNERWEISFPKWLSVWWVGSKIWTFEMGLALVSSAWLVLQESVRSTVCLWKFGVWGKVSVLGLTWVLWVGLFIFFFFIFLVNGGW